MNNYFISRLSSVIYIRLENEIRLEDCINFKLIKILKQYDFKAIVTF